MKVFNTIIALLFFVSGLGASVDPYDIVVVGDPTNNTLLLRSTVAFKHDCQLQLLNWEDQAIYVQDLAEGTFLNRRIRQTAIPNGSYTLVMSDATGRTEIPLSLSRSGVVYEVVKAKRTIYPRVDLQDERILVVNYTNETGKRVEVSLTNENGREVFADRTEGQTIRRAYQLDQLEAGNYTVTVSSQSVKNYTAAIALQ